MARAGDILRALCLAVTGTFRKITPATGSPLYVLTDDIEGIGARRARIAEWARDANALEWRQREALEKQITARQPMQYLAFAPDDPLALSSGLLQKIQQKWASSPAKSGLVALDVPVTELAPAQQAFVREAAARAAETSYPVRGDRVRLDVHMRLFYVVAGGGVVSNPHLYFESLSTLTPRLPASDAPPPAVPVVLPPFLPAHALHIAPTSVKEAQRAAREARKRGFTQLWVSVDGESQSGLLRAAITAGKENGLTVLAVARVLRTTGEAATLAANLDRNILGETASAHDARRLSSPEAQRGGYALSGRRELGDWLRPDAPAVVTAVKQRLADLGASPGLAGLVLRDTTPPGYAESGDADFHVFNESADFGYNPEPRLAFLRQEGIDPVDLDRPGYQSNIRLPFFADANPRPSYLLNAEGRMVRDRSVRGPVHLWNGLRYRVGTRFLADIFAAVRSTHPDLPLLIQNVDTPSFAFSGGAYQTWYGSWDKADTLPRRTPHAGSVADFPATFSRMARNYSRRVLLPIVYEPPHVTDVKPEEEIQRFARFLQMRLREVPEAPGLWDGLVLDLSAMPVDKALPLLEGIIPARQETTINSP